MMSPRFALLPGRRGAGTGDRPTRGQLGCQQPKFNYLEYIERCYVIRAGHAKPSTVSFILPDEDDDCFRVVFDKGVVRHL